MKPKVKLFITAITLAVCLPLLAQKKYTGKFVFTPQWTAHAQFAGYYVAQEKGFYKAEGLDVDIVHPSVSETAMHRIQEAENDRQDRLGDERLLEAMQGTEQLTSEEVIHRLQVVVNNHRAGAEPNDDLTLLCLSIRK